MKCLREYCGVPKYLQKHTMPFVAHVKDRLYKAIVELTPASVAVSSNPTFRISASSASGTSYDVDLSIPYCSCIDWSDKGLPCKHMMLPIHLKLAQWSDFADDYRLSVHNTIDEEFLYREPFNVPDSPILELNAKKKPFSKREESELSKSQTSGNVSQNAESTSADETGSVNEDATIASTPSFQDEEDSDSSSNLLPPSDVSSDDDEMEENAEASKKEKDKLLEVTEVLKSLAYNCDAKLLVAGVTEEVDKLIERIHNSLPQTKGIATRNSPKKRSQVRRKAQTKNTHTDTQLSRKIITTQKLMKELPRHVKRQLKMGKPQKGRPARRRNLFKPDRRVAAEDANNPDISTTEESDEYEFDENSVLDTDTTTEFSQTKSIFNQSVSPKKRSKPIPKSIEKVVDVRKFFPRTPNVSNFNKQSTSRGNTPVTKKTLKVMPFRTSTPKSSVKESTSGSGSASSSS